MKFLEHLLSKHNLWTLAKVSGLCCPLARTLHCVWCLGFGVWCLFGVCGLGLGVWGSEQAVSCVLRPSCLFPGDVQSGLSVSGPSCCLCSQCCCRGSKDGDTGCYWCERNCAEDMKFAQETLKQKLPPQMWSCQGLALMLQFYNIFFHYPIFFAYLQDNYNFDVDDVCLIWDLFKI